LDLAEIRIRIEDDFLTLVPLLEPIGVAANRVVHRPFSSAYFSIASRATMRNAELFM
jgi:hypothetical protein